MATTSQQIQVLINGNMVTLDVDSDIWGQGTLASRPASGDNTGDLYLIVDPPLLGFSRWNGASWIGLQGDPVNAAGGGAHGDTLYRNATAWVVLPASGATQYQLLQTNAVSANPAWTAKKYYPDSATDPVSPSPADGDLYNNTVLDMLMQYDGTRAKWLSVAEDQMIFARNGNTAGGAFYRMADGKAYSSASGRYMEHAGTVTSISYTRTDTDAATFEVTAAGTGFSTLASTAIAGNVTNLNDDFSADVVLGVKNQTAGNTTSQVSGWIRFRWRV